MKLGWAATALVVNGAQQSTLVDVFGHQRGFQTHPNEPLANQQTRRSAKPVLVRAALTGFSVYVCGASVSVSYSSNIAGQTRLTTLICEESFLRGVG